MRAERAMPILQVADVAATATWFEGAGFALAGTWSDDAGPSFGIVVRDHVTLGLRRGTPDPSDGWSAYLYVSDIAAWLDLVRALGRLAPAEPVDTPYGCRETEIVTPDGHRLAMAQDLSPGPNGPGL